ncbi:DUF4342 domain-containing protein [Clostridium rectalis]|uniref:DUF4342 domain-containing protein n=1 Tax=Clostridium rectalis TaxID=2040295 RepID=UPI000F633403|nr:DUF4342 domain-containing protein [Clostridium rectalis]
MNETTLEKIDIIRERTGATYSEAKEALDVCNGNVVDALIYIEEKKKKENPYVTKDEFIAWLKDLVNKGNISRIKVKKEDKVVIDIPVNAGALVTLTALIVSPFITLILFAAALTQVTVEITKSDGSVEVVNKIIKTTVNDVREKVHETTSNMKDKFKKGESYSKEDSIYSYTVNFEESNEDEDKKEKQ